MTLWSKNVTLLTGGTEWPSDPKLWRYSRGGTKWPSDLKTWRYSRGRWMTFQMFRCGTSTCCPDLVCKSCAKASQRCIADAHLQPAPPSSPLLNLHSQHSPTPSFASLQPPFPSHLHISLVNFHPCALPSFFIVLNWKNKKLNWFTGGAFSPKFLHPHNTHHLYRVEY